MSDSPKFSKFDVSDVAYKYINNVAIHCSIISPKGLSTTCRHPVIVRWHGGALITGHRLFPGWFSDWTLALAEKTGAVIIAPDYRLLPESSGLDILDDVKDFWAWLFGSSFGSSLPVGLSVDLDHILLTGESAGGYLALQSALLGFAPLSKVSSMVLQYAMLDVGDRHFNEDYHKDLFDPPLPQIDRSVLRHHLVQLKGGEIVTEAMPPLRLDLVISALQQGTFGNFIGPDRKLYPFDALQRRTEALPPVWIYHGVDDNVVPISGTHRFVDVWKRTQGDIPLHVSYPPGNHGFDAQDPAPTVAKDKWLADGIEFLSRFWPQV